MQILLKKENVININVFLDYKEIQGDKKRMEHFSTICACLQEFLSGYSLPNPCELISIYGRVRNFFLSS